MEAESQPQNLPTCTAEQEDPIAHVPEIATEDRYSVLMVWEGVPPNRQVIPPHRECLGHYQHHRTIFIWHFHKESNTDVPKINKMDKNAKNSLHFLLPSRI